MMSICSILIFLLFLVLLKICTDHPRKNTAVPFRFSMPSTFVKLPEGLTGKGVREQCFDLMFFANVECCRTFTLSREAFASNSFLMEDCESFRSNRFSCFIGKSSPFCAPTENNLESNPAAFFAVSKIAERRTKTLCALLPSHPSFPPSRCLDDANVDGVYECKTFTFVLLSFTK